MCLLKRSDRDTNCGHDDCKNFYMLNKQMCMYNMNPTIQTINPQNNALTTIQSQLQLGSLLSQKSNTPTVNITQSLNVKRPNNTPLENSIGEQETVFLNKKKVKPEDEGRNEDSNQNIFANNLADLNLLSQQILNQAPNNQQSNFINTLATNNGQIMLAKPDGSGGYTLGNNTIYIPVMQAPQGNVNINASYAPVIANNQSGFTPTNGAQVLSQNLRMKSASTNNTYNSINMSNDQTSKSNNTSNMNSASSNGTISSSPNSSNTMNNQIMENFMKEFQSKTSGLLLSQNKMLLELKEKNEIIQDTLACLINEMSALKNIIKQSSTEKVPVPNSSSILMSMNLNPTEAGTTDTLLNLLYGQKQNFNYELIMKSNLTLPLYRERNFKFTLLLTDKEGNIINNTNRIPLTIAIYSSENVPKFIDANTSGNKILKGFIEKDLVNGTVTFEKIQIKEVTSHFRNGWVFFVVYPKISSNNLNVLNSAKGNVINSQQIKPFILEKVVVKAKKAKERDFENDNENENEEGESRIFEEDGAKKNDEDPSDE